MTDKSFDYEGFRKQIVEGYASGDTNGEEVTEAEAAIVELAKNFADAHGEIAVQTIKLLHSGVVVGDLIRTLNMLSISAVNNAVRMGGKQLGKDAISNLKQFAAHDYVNSMLTKDDNFITSGDVRPGDFRGH